MSCLNALRDAAIVALLVTVFSACGAGGADRDSTASSGDATPRAETSCVITWSDAYARRFQAGETFFLPGVAESPECANLAWTLTGAPSESEAELITGVPYARITPLHPGDYTFALVGADGSVEGSVDLQVIDALERPFHNYNYFPSHRAVALVGDELWSAGVYTPQVARFDPTGGVALEPILVGQWPTALAYAETQGIVLVANKASDTLGVIDVATLRQVDAIWVGDAPSDIVWDAARGRAYVSLAGAGQIAVVDVPGRTLLTTLDAVFDPLAIAMSPEGDTLAVASHRSGQSSMYPHDEREVETERDVALVDLETLEVTGHILEVAATIQAMNFSDDGTLWVSATSNNTEGKLSDPESLSFQHELFTLAPMAGLAQRAQSVDLSRQPTSGGSTATIHGFAFCGDTIWVAAEGANLAVQLAADLTELRRVPVEGRPRALVCDGDAVWVLSATRMSVTRIAGEAVDTYPLGLTDRRDERLRVGLERFTGQGVGSGDNRSCNNCHADGLSDGVVWNAGPVVSRLLSRPLRWLEGTAMIGWDGYVGSVKVSGYVGGATINDRGDTTKALAMGAYLASLMPSPPANSLTRRDGALSDEALAGKAIFEGEGACAGCHPGPVFTNQQVQLNGLTEGRTDTPSLIDVALIGSWYKTGVMPTLHDTVADTAHKLGVDLTADGVTAVTRYLQELTGRDFFPLDVDLGPDAEAFPVDGAARLTFSFPVLDADDNLARLTLSDALGADVALKRAVDGRHVTLTPKDSLAPDTRYTLTIAQGFQADDGRTIPETSTYAVETASPTTLGLDGVYDLTVWVPMFKIGEGGFDMDNIVPQTSRFTATPTENGAEVQLNYGGNMFYDELFVVDGSTVLTRDLPVALGPSFLNGSPIASEGQDTDGDGVIDTVEGTFVLSGPGMHLPDIAFAMTKVTLEPGACIPGAEGHAPPVVTEQDGEVIVDWGSVGALSLLVTSPDASLPMGPGVVEGGQTYWVVATTDFPTTFAGPVTYGVVPDGAADVSEDSGGPLGGAPLESGECYRFSVVSDLKYSHTTILWP